MTIPKRITVNESRPEQVRLFVRCVNDLQAEALRRALSTRFHWVSTLMPSFNSNFSHFLFVTATQEAVEELWDEVCALAGTAVAATSSNQPGGIAGAPATHGSAPQSQSALEPLLAWQSRFHDAVSQVHADLPRQSQPGQELNLSWVEERIREADFSSIEAALNEPLLSSSSILRTHIALYSAREEYEKIVALYETRQREILALPTSNVLVEQLLRAYIGFGRQHQIAEARQTVRAIAQTFLPELERLHQAERIRALLREEFPPEQPVSEPMSETLTERLAAIVQVSPAEQIMHLEALAGEHRSLVLDIQLALAAAYAAADNLDAALTIYATAPTHDEASRMEVLRRRAELLLDAGRYRDVLDLIPADPELDTSLQMLRGVALYWSGQTAAALALLEPAWAAGVYARPILLPLARSWAATNQHERAIRPYRMMLNQARDLLEAADYAYLAETFYIEQPEDVNSNQIIECCEAYLQANGSQNNALERTSTVLEIRCTLLLAGGDERWIPAWTDRLEFLASQQDLQRLAQMADDVRTLRQRQAISREEHFHLLEIVEPYVPGISGLAEVLSGEYMSIGMDEINASLRLNQPVPTYMNWLRRALHFLDRDSATMLNEHLRVEQEALIHAGLDVLAEPDQDEPITLTGERLALVGGHEHTRREVASELRKTYNLTECIDVAPSSEGRVDRTSVYDKIAQCSLVAVITGYTGHDLTNIVRDLDQAGALHGQVLWLRTRGKSGVVREILHAYAGGSHASSYE